MKSSLTEQGEGKLLKSILQHWREQGNPPHMRLVSGDGRVLDIRGMIEGATLMPAYDAFGTRVLCFTQNPYYELLPTIPEGSNVIAIATRRRK